MTTNNRAIDEHTDFEEHIEPTQPVEHGVGTNPTAEASLADELSRKLSQLQAFGRDVSAFINGFQLNIDREHGAVQINLRKKTRPLVELIPLLQYCEEVHPLQAIIGWDQKQEPMIWSADQSTRHLLISGAPQSGKTGLLRSLILTLVLASRPAQLQFALVDGSCRSGNSYDHSGLKKFSHLPHLLNRPPANPEEVCEIITFLAKEADHRLSHNVKTPQILLIIDNLQDILPVAGPDFHQELEHILDIGPQTGIRVILATNRPEDGRLQDLISGIEIDRMAGKVQSAGQATFASGRDNSEAEHLNGDGEFLAILKEKEFHFQAAWVSEKHLKRYLGYLNQQKQPALLAWTIPNDDYVEEDQVSEFRYGFLEKAETVEDTENVDAGWADEEVEEDDDEVTFDPEPVKREFDIQEQDVEEDYFELSAESFVEDEDEKEPEEDRLTLLENIYTKLSGFDYKAQEADFEDANEVGPDAEDDAETVFSFDRDHDLEDAHDGVDESAEWDSLEYEKVEDRPEQPKLIFHEEPSDYHPQSNGWLDHTPDASKAIEDDTGDAEEEELIDEPQEKPEPQVRLNRASFELDEEDQEDPFSFSAETISKSGRRSSFNQPKPKPKPKPVSPVLNSESEDPDTFDPWQNGLDDLGDLGVDEYPEKEDSPSFTRPPRLAKRKSPTVRRRVARPASKFKSKPKIKSVSEKPFNDELQTDGELE